MKLKRIYTREEFLNKIKTDGLKSVNEAFSNDVNWGDSWVGILFSSINRKIKNVYNYKRIDSISSRLRDLLDSIIEESKIDVDMSIVNFLKSSFIMGDIVDSVNNKEEIPNIIQKCENLISQIKTYNISDKDAMIEPIEEFIEFLRGIQDNEDDLDDEDSDVDVDTDDNNDTKIFTYSEMVMLLKQTKDVIDNMPNIRTTTEDSSIKAGEAKDINYIFKHIMNEVLIINKNFKNNLFQGKSDIELPIIEVNQSNNSIVYRKSLNLVQMRDRQLVATLPKWDSKNQKWVGDEKPRVIEFTKENIKRMANWIIDSNEEIKSIIKSDIKLKPTEGEVNWLNSKLKGKFFFKKEDTKSYNAEILNFTNDGYVVIDIKAPSDVNISSKKVSMSCNNILNCNVLANVVITNDQLNKAKNQGFLLVNGDKYSLNNLIINYKKVSLTNEEVDYLRGDETILNNKLTELKKQFTYLSGNDKNIAVTSQFLGKIIDDSKRYKNIIKLLISDIKRDLSNLITKEKSKETKVSESIAIISDIDKRKVVSDKLSRFLNICYKFNDEDYGGLDKLSGYMKKLNQSISNLIEGDINTPDKYNFVVGDKVRYIKNDGTESITKITKIEGDKFYFNGKNGKGEEVSLYKNISDIIEKIDESYNKYIDYMFIKEAVDYDLIVDKFNEIFPDEVLELYQIPDENIEDIKNAGEITENYVLRNHSAIIEIARLFIRAWRIHTPGRIPSGRTNGRVSGRIFDQYEYIGDGSGGTPEQPGVGPYRNIELYSRFEESILSIFSDNKYKTTIFSEEATFSFNAEDITKDAVFSREELGRMPRKEDNINKPLGKILLQYMISLLNDVKMYKGGALTIFLEQYFGIKGSVINKEGGYDIFKGDSKSVALTTRSIPTAVDAKWVGLSEVTNSVNINTYFHNNKGAIKGMMFRLTNSDGNYSYYKYYGYINNQYYFIYTKDYIIDPLSVNVKPQTVLSPSSDVRLIKVPALSDRGFSGEISNNNITERSPSVMNQFSEDGTLEVLVDNNGDVITLAKYRAEGKINRFLNVGGKK